ncbi:MAG TPA: SMP-30/gluconolactonase/LRE family protein, partial [Caulobacteraceae bacterium]|nr:SMP-30/gluconolactonase/LRE family protein [Caulobacteraceae bacterium]
MDITLVAEGLQFPEGPVVMADGSIILTEIRAGRISKVWPDGRRETVAETGGGPNGLAIGPDGALYVCNNGGRFTWIDAGPGVMYPGEAPPEHKGGSIQRVDLATGKVTTLYDNHQGKPIWAPNDIVFDRTGGFWFTDHSRS